MKIKCKNCKKTAPLYTKRVSKTGKDSITLFTAIEIPHSEEGWGCDWIIRVDIDNRITQTFCSNSCEGQYCNRVAYKKVKGAQS